MASRSRCHSSATASNRSGAGSGGGAASLSVFAEPFLSLSFRLSAKLIEASRNTCIACIVHFANSVTAFDPQICMTDMSSLLCHRSQANCNRQRLQPHAHRVTRPASRTRKVPTSTCPRRGGEPCCTLHATRVFVFEWSFKAGTPLA